MASIMESALERNSIDLPRINELWILTDGATCFSNVIIWIFVLFIGKGRGLALQSYTHSRAAVTRACRCPF